MDFDTVVSKLKSGDLVRDGTKLYTREEWKQIREMEAKVDHFDLLQLTKKIQLKQN